MKASVEIPAPVPEPQGKPRGSTRGTIMVVEDEPGVRALISSVLRGAGFEVVEAEDGEAALAVGTERLDAVVTDVVMPGMSGTVLARRLRQVHPGIPMLFVSGYAHDQRPGTLANMQGTAYLQKPFAPDELVEKLRGLMDTAPPKGRW
ncbi:MAG: response regulator [Acidobacteria bacterium]|nr:response regulator [Acidobacteriota bacterium]